MFGFTISKMNLLILVLAIFAIVTYFMFGWSTVLVKFSAKQIVDKQIGSAVYNKINSGSICDKTPMVRVPPSISYFAGVGSGGRYFYKIIISKIEPENDKNYLLIKAVSRKDPDIVLATAYFPTHTSIRLIDWVEKPDGKQCHFEETDSLELDPQKAMFDSIIPKDAVSIVLEQYQGEKTIFIIACSSAEETQCMVNRGLVGCYLKSEREGHESTCIRIDECCADNDSDGAWDGDCDCFGQGDSLAS